MIERADLLAAVEQAADSIVITDTNGNIQYVNPAFTAMTGYAREEAVGQNPRMLKSGIHTAEFYKELWDTVAAGRVWCGELINRRKDGTLYHEEMRVTPVQDESGKTVSYIAVKHDVTMRLEAEEAQRLLTAAIENSEDAVFSYSSAGIILTWNRGAESIFGYGAADAIGQHRAMLVPPDWLPRSGDFLEKILGGTPSRSTKRCAFARMDGAFRYALRDPLSGTAPERSWPFPSFFGTSRSARTPSKPAPCWPRSWSLRRTRFTP